MDRVEKPGQSYNSWYFQPLESTSPACKRDRCPRWLLWSQSDRKNRNSIFIRAWQGALRRALRVIRGLQTWLNHHVVLLSLNPGEGRMATADNKTAGQEGRWKKCCTSKPLGGQRQRPLNREHFPALQEQAESCNDDGRTFPQLKTDLCF